MDSLPFIKPEISIVVPVYGAANLLGELVEKVSKAVAQIEGGYEIILVEDHSPDDSWKNIELAAKANPNVLGVKLSKNFGQHAAITAGLNYAKGNWMVIMDCDLQDKPEELPKLYAKAKEGYEVVLAKRQSKEHSIFKRAFSRSFYYLLSSLTDTKQDASIANFGIYKREVIQAILRMGDYVKYIPTMVQWVGFNVGFLEVKHGKRPDGQSGYNFNRLVQLGLNVILSFSNKPLMLVVKLGLIISIISILFIIYNLVFYFLKGFEVMGYASLIISLWFLSGIIITSIGMVGLYVGRIFDQTKRRPVFIVEKTVNHEN